MGRVIEQVQRLATGRRVAWAWAVFFGFALVVFPAFDAVNGMPEDVTPLDIRFVYDADTVAAVLAELGEGGRAAYLRSLLIADIAWPLVYGSTLALTIAWGFVGSAWQRRLISLPLLAVLWDLAENTLVSIQIVRFPSFTRWLATVGSGVSAVKWVFAIAATVAGLVALVLGWRRRQAVTATGTE